MMANHPSRNKRAVELEEALRAVLPYAHTRAEDMNEAGGDLDPDWLKADAAVTNAYRVLGETA